MKLDVRWRPQSVRGLSKLSFERRSAIERAVGRLSDVPDEGDRVKNVCGAFHEITAGGYRIFYLVEAGGIQVTGLRRL